MKRNGCSWPNPEEEAAKMGGFAFCAVHQYEIDPELSFARVPLEHLLLTQSRLLRPGL